MSLKKCKGEILKMQRKQFFWGVCTAVMLMCMPQQVLAESNSEIRNVNGNLFYYENGEINKQKNGFVSYKEGLFYVGAGRVLQEVSGLAQDPNGTDWYYLANGQAQTQYTGLAMYDGAWFYVENGKLDTTLADFVSYDNSLFYVGLGRVMTEVNGLAQDPNGTDWYYLAEGQAQTQYTGLAMYDGAWFYVVNGKLANDYTGMVAYDGSEFYVVNGMVNGTGGTTGETTPDIETVPDTDTIPDTETVPDTEVTPDKEETPDTETTPDTEITDVSKFLWTTSATDAIITGVAEGMTDTEIVIPSTYNGLPVIAIADGAFFETPIVSVTIPSSVKTIGQAAFKYCDKLKNVTIEEGVQSIGWMAFMGCESLTSIVIPDSVTTMEDSVFSVCTNLSNVTLSNNLTALRGTTFSTCKSLTKITIPNSVKLIEEWTFVSCVHLKTVTYNGVDYTSLVDFKRAFESAGGKLEDDAFQVFEEDAEEILMEYVI